MDSIYRQASEQDNDWHLSCIRYVTKITQVIYRRHTSADQSICICIDDVLLSTKRTYVYRDFSKPIFINYKVNSIDDSSLFFNTYFNIFSFDFQHFKFISHQPSLFHRVIIYTKKDFILQSMNEHVVRNWIVEYIHSLTNRWTDDHHITLKIERYNLITSFFCSLPLDCLCYSEWWWWWLNIDLFFNRCEKNFMSKETKSY